jgi:hypothetical protein
LFLLYRISQACLMERSSQLYWVGSIQEIVPRKMQEVQSFSATSPCVVSSGIRYLSSCLLYAFSSGFIYMTLYLLHWLIDQLIRWNEKKISSLCPCRKFTFYFKLRGGFSKNTLKKCS